MPQRDDLSRSLIAFQQDSTLVAVVELSRSSWLVAGIVPGIGRHPLKKLAPDEEALLAAAAALAGRGGRGRAHDHPPRGRLRGRARRLLARPLAAGARRRGPRHPPDERRRLARAPAGQDRPARHRAAQARLPGLAARRAGPLQHGRGPDPRAGGRQAPEPRARGPGRRAHPDREPDEGRPGPPGRPRLQADPARTRPSAWRRCAPRKARRCRRTRSPSCAATWRGCGSCGSRSRRSRRRASSGCSRPPRTGRTRWSACWPGWSGSGSRPPTCWCARCSRASCGTARPWPATPG